MDSSSSEVAYDFSPMIKIYKDGRVERLSGTDVVPPSFDLKTNVESRDIVTSKEPAISARLFVPKIADPARKLPLLVYFHGGGFAVETPFSPIYHNYLNSVVAAANVIAVSVDYRRAPEHPVPIAHEDSWASLKWVASHCDGNGSEESLNRHADFGKIFLAGDSAGANIAHHMAIRVGTEGLPGINLEGVVLFHPYFWGNEPVGSEMEREARDRRFAADVWQFMCPTTEGSDDAMINPGKDPRIGKLGCRRMMICVAEKDMFKDRGWYYREVVEKSGWCGVVEMVETKEKDHVFHLFNPTGENAIALLNRFVSFITQN